MTAIYSTGTVTVTNGSTAVVGTGTAWAISLVKGGTLNIEAAGGNTMPIASVTDDTHLTGAVKWTGADGTYPYAIVRESSDAASTVDVYDRLSRILVTLSLAGIHPNASGTIAQRNAIDLDTDDEGFLFLHAEIGVAFAFYRWTSTAWEGPFAVATAVSGDGVQSIVPGTGISIDSTNPDVPVVGLDADLAAWAGVTRASGFDTFAATPSSANLAALVTGQTGTGALVFGTSPVLVTPALGTPSALVLTNATALPNAAVSATLTADKAFRRGNILATVSQSSGVPTGGIVERGSNANGEYVRYADGTQICSMAYDATADAWTTVSGGLFISGSILWTYPAAFSGIVPTVFGGTSRSADEARGLGARNITSSAANLRFWSSVSIAATVAKSGQMTAIGRWF